jgi:hypothetical protein
MRLANRGGGGSLVARAPNARRDRIAQSEQGGVMSSQTCWRAAALVGRIGWLSLAATAGLSAGQPAQAQDAAPITIVINQSPWFEGFRGLVEYYEEQTGNQVELDDNPFAGSIEKQRSSAWSRNPCSER